MAPLVVGEVVRYAVNGLAHGQQHVSIFDIKLDQQGLTNRDTKIVPVAEDLLNQWDDHILQYMSTSYQAISVSWVDLDSLGGTTGEITSSPENTWPKEGLVSGPPLPNNTYRKCVKLLQNKQRNERNGILRLGGVSEGFTENNDGHRLTEAHRGALQASLEDLKDGINGENEQVAVNIGVVHRPNSGSPSFSTMAEFFVEPLVGTIRRRMPGYGL